jgi:hypothetical protein
MAGLLWEFEFEESPHHHNLSPLDYSFVHRDTSNVITTVPSTMINWATQETTTIYIRKRTKKLTSAAHQSLKKSHQQLSLAAQVVAAADLLPDHPHH